MPRKAPDYEITEVVLDDLPSDRLEDVVALINTISVEREPRHSDFTAEEFLVYANMPGFVRRRFGVVGSDGEVMAVSELSHRDDSTNARLLRVNIAVSPDHRRKGIATDLLRVAVDIASELGRTMLSGNVFDTVPAGAEFARAVGAKPTLDFHSNVVRIADLDVDLLRGWVDDGPRRGRGYSVRILEGMYPDDLLEGMAHLYYVLERDAPSPDGHEPRVYTPELVTQFIGQFLAASEILTSVATHDETREVAGMSQLVRRHTDPKTWFVSTTMVDPPHRGHALGKWLKAAVNLHALEMWPGAVWQETGNAFTNDAMLAINHAMGFRHEYTMSDMEVSREDASRYLVSRAAGVT